MIDIAFTDAIGNPALFEVIDFADVSAGRIELRQLSLLSDAALLARQGGDAVALATLGFTYLGPDPTVLSIDLDAPNGVFGSGGLPLDVLAFSAQATPVPEPGTAPLLLMGLLALRAQRRRPQTWGQGGRRGCDDLRGGPRLPAGAARTR